MPISKFRITNAGPFDDITFEFDEQVNVFVGPNNSGKSTALLALATASVHPFQFPGKLFRKPPWEVKCEIAVLRGNKVTKSELLLAEPVSDYQTRIDLLSAMGFSTFIPSIRRSTEFRTGVPETESMRQLVALMFSSPEAQDLQNLNELQKRSLITQTDASLVSDESVIQRMVELDYLAYFRRQPQIKDSIQIIARIASEITEGYPIEFLGVGGEANSRFAEFRTPDGNLPLNTLSQGTQSIIQWLSRFLFGFAQYYRFPDDLTEKPGVLIVDEIDVHLHPSWQRRIIPALTKNFPNLQIFCSTHSPLMLAGLGEGQVQLLNRDEDGKVTVSRNRWDMAGWSAEEILRNVLEVRDTIDIATASEIDRMGELSIKDTLTDEETHELEEIRNRVSRGLLDGPPSSQVESFLQFIKEVYTRQASNAGSSGRTRPRVRRRESGAK